MLKTLKKYKILKISKILNSLATPNLSDGSIQNTWNFSKNRFFWEFQICYILKLLKTLNNSKAQNIYKKVTYFFQIFKFWII